MISARLNQERMARLLLRCRDQLERIIPFLETAYRFSQRSGAGSLLEELKALLQELKDGPQDAAGEAPPTPVDGG